MYNLHRQDLRYDKQAMSKLASCFSLVACSAVYFLGENGGSTFLRNTGELLPDYKMSALIKQYSSSESRSTLSQPNSLTSILILLFHLQVRFSRWLFSLGFPVLHGKAHNKAH
jgi:hypothetical protein